MEPYGLAECVLKDTLIDVFKFILHGVLLGKNYSHYNDFSDASDVILPAVVLCFKAAGIM